MVKLSLKKNTGILKKEEAQELLRNYRLGRCTKRESEIIERWYQSLDKDKADLSEMDDLSKLGKQMLENITNKIEKKEEIKRSKGKEKSIKKLDVFKNMKRIAAVFLLGTALAFFLYNQYATKEVGTQEMASVEISPSIIYLPDGSVVWLKGESRLNYPKNFTGATREVTLVGEAFFDIAKDQKMPFIIHTTNFTTAVLGTSFNIKAYENDQSQEVAVVTGKVLVSVKDDIHKRREVILQPNEKIIFIQKDDSLLKLDAIEHSDYAALAKSKLAFKEAALGDIIKVLNSAHDINISLANKNMKNCVITADLTHETLEISIEILSKAIHAEVTMNGKDIILSGQGCRNQQQNY